MSLTSVFHAAVNICEKQIFECNLFVLINHLVFHYTVQIFDILTLINNNFLITYEFYQFKIDIKMYISDTKTPLSFIAAVHIIEGRIKLYSLT